MMLADLGAEVIKLEERVGGDPGRGVMSIAGAMVGATSGPNFYFEANNRHKQSITLDLKKPEAQEIVYKLAEKSDVFVQNFRQGVAGKLGIGSVGAAAQRDHARELHRVLPAPDKRFSGAPGMGACRRRCADPVLRRALSAAIVTDGVALRAGPEGYGQPARKAGLYSGRL